MTTKTSNSVIAAQTALLKRTKAVEEWADQLAKAEAALAHSENAQPSTPTKPEHSPRNVTDGMRCPGHIGSRHRQRRRGARRAVIAAEAGHGPGDRTRPEAVAAHQQRRELLASWAPIPAQARALADVTFTNPAETRLKATVKRLQTTQQPSPLPAKAATDQRPTAGRTARLAAYRWRPALPSGPRTSRTRRRSRTPPPGNGGRAGRTGRSREGAQPDPRRAHLRSAPTARITGQRVLGEAPGRHDRRPSGRPADHRTPGWAKPRP